MTGSDGGSHPVEHLLRSMQERLVALSLYGTDEPEGLRAKDQVRLAFGPVWSMGPQLLLTVSAEGVNWRGLLLAGSQDRNGIGWKWHRAGLETLEFSPGVEAEEIIRFLEVVHQAEALDPEDEDDLCTLLWREDFQHLHYTSVDRAPGVERQIPSTARVGPPPAANAVREKVREEVSSSERTSGIVRIEKFDSTLYFLDPAEIDYLRDAIEKEYAQDHAINVIDLLIDTFELQPDSDTREEVLSVLGEFLPHLLGNRNFKASGYLVSQINAFKEMGVGLTKEQALALDAITSGLSGPEALGQLFHTLQDQDDLPSGEELGELLAHLAPDAMGTLLKWMKRLSAQEGREVLEAALLQNFRAQPQSLERALDSPDAGVVLRGLELVRRVRLEPNPTTLSKLAVHADAGVRNAVVPILAMTKDPSAVRHLARMVQDPDGDVRISVLRALSSRPFKGAVGPLEATIKAPDIEDRDLGEKRGLFETYGKLAGPGGVPLLSSLLLARRGFGKKGPSSDTRACAALALGEIGTPPARRILEKAIRDRDPVVRNAVQRALR